MTQATATNISMPTGFLCIPRPQSLESVKVLRRVKLLALKELIRRPLDDLPPRLARAVGGARGMLDGALRRSPETVVEAVGAPDVLIDLLCLASGARPAEGLLARAVPNLLFQLARQAPRAHFTHNVLWDWPVERLVDERDGIVCDTGLQGMIVGPQGAELRGRSGKTLDADALRSDLLVALHPELPRLRLALFDDNPLADEEAHPDKSGNALDLSDHSVPDWQAGYRTALDLVERYLPEIFGEFRQTFRRLVPVGYGAEMHMSASYRQGPGVVYATLHPDPVTLAEALVHETQHGKLNALTWLDPVLDNGHTEWATSPVRPDLRPLMGVLLAVHAFAPVSALLVRMLRANDPLTRPPRFTKRLADVLAGNAHGLQTLAEKAQPTKLGSRVLADLNSLHMAVSQHAPAATASAEGVMWPG